MSDIAIGKADPSFKYEVASHPGADTLKKCFSCGTCTGACPVFRVEEAYNPRKIIRQILLGLREDVLKSNTIWLCARCYACTSHCPQGVSFADVMVVLRDMAIKAGYAPEDMHEKIECISDAAHAFRRDAINAVTAGGEFSADEALENLKNTMEKTA